MKILRVKKVQFKGDAAYLDDKHKVEGFLTEAYKKLIQMGQRNDVPEKDFKEINDSSVMVSKALRLISVLGTKR